MADVNKSVEFTLRAKTAPLEQSLRKIPEVTDKEAKKMVRKLDKAFDQVEKEAKKTAKSTKKSFKSMKQSASIVPTNVRNVV